MVFLSQSTSKLATDIIETCNIIEEAISGFDTFEGSDDENMQDVLDLPLREKYRLLLKDLRFDYMSMKDPATSRYKHSYASYVTA